MSMANHATIRISFPIVTGAPFVNIIQVPLHLLLHQHRRWNLQKHNLSLTSTMTTTLMTLIHALLVCEEPSHLAVVVWTDLVPCFGAYLVAPRTLLQFLTTIPWVDRGHSNSIAAHPATTHFSIAQVRIQIRTSLPPTMAIVLPPQM